MVVEDDGTCRDVLCLEKNNTYIYGDWKPLIDFLHKMEQMHLRLWF